MKSVILYKIVRKRNDLTLVTKFPAKNGESSPLKNNTSSGQTASHQDKKEVSSKGKLPNRNWKHRKDKSSTRASSLLARDADALGSIKVEVEQIYG